MTKFNNPDIEKKVLNILREANMPASVDYVANHLKISWGTARAILLDLALEGKIRAEKTTKSLIFSVSKEDEARGGDS